MIARLPKTAFKAACSDLPVVAERRTRRGQQVEFEVGSSTELEDRLAEAACAAADAGDYDLMERLYIEFDRMAE